MDEMGTGGWLVLWVVLIVIVWGGFLAWQGGLAKRWLQAWGLRGARAFKQPGALVEPPQAHRRPGGHGGPGSHGHGHGQTQPGPAHHGKRHDRGH